ncbi:VOC family protein [Sphingobacterium zeae]|uniref:VOC family protein n=1 Tax=Sphingobacterium zeae TaxID=1776859 RepID=UPI00362353CE
MIGIEDVAIWADDLEKMRKFYSTYFNMVSSEKYTNKDKGFTSYFLSFAASRTRLEIMNKYDITEEPLRRGFHKGITHIAISVGDKETVDLLTERLRSDCYKIIGEPRTTGDGYYESVVLDPEGNHIEITI